jgi:hypothetical protein
VVGGKELMDQGLAIRIPYSHDDSQVFPIAWGTPEDLLRGYKGYTVVKYHRL